MIEVCGWGSENIIEMGKMVMEGEGYGRAEE
jgi:hypothetical protein